MAIEETKGQSNDQRLPRMFSATFPREIQDQLRARARWGVGSLHVPGLGVATSGLRLGAESVRVVWAC